MKRFFTALALSAVAALCLAAFPACGGATVSYKLSDDGTYYILSGVSGFTNSLETYEVPAEYTDPDTGATLPVKKIGDDAFMGCSSLTYVTIPEGVEEIGQRAFMQCGFRKFTIPETVKKISYGAFAQCDALEEITIPESVTRLEQKAFYHCSALEKVVLKAEISDLEYSVFENILMDHAGQILNATSLTELYLPSSVKKINNFALYGNTGLKDIYYEGTPQQWEEVAIYEWVKAEDSNQAVEKIFTAEEKATWFNGITIHYEAEF